METSAAACVSRLPHPPPILFSPFSDQTHVDFYRCSAPLPALRLRLPPSRVLTHVSSVPPPRALCDRAVLEPPLPQAPSLVLQELAQLKMQMKQKKKELKAQKKEEKLKVKMQLKEEKKARKQKGLPEGQRQKMKKCSSETSSSSSESSDDDCESLSMRMLRRERMITDHSDDGVVRSGHVERDDGAAAKVKVADPIAISSVGSRISRLNEDATELAADIVPVLGRSPKDVCGLLENEGSLNGNSATERSYQSICQTQGSLSSARKPPPIFPSTQCANRIEVCAGGKCKKAGSEHLLSALRANIPNSADVKAVPCKCMGKCSMAMNVKVHKEDTNPQHHSHVRVEDANLILSHHFGLGRPPTGLPSIPSDERMRQPAPLSAPACAV